MLKLGSVLDGKYKIISVIGQGGMSTVYLARHQRLNKEWAVKEISREYCENYEMISRQLVLEADILKKLNHPGLPKIIDIIEKKETEVLSWGKQLCEVLSYLHSRTPPIIYRDLKPDNIILKKTGRLVLIDFGTAREYCYEKNSTDTTYLGTRGYAAPEQYQGYLSPRSDIYALGKTMEKLCGKKKWQCFLYPEFFWFLFRCTRKQEKYRYLDMSAVQKRIQKLEIRYRTVTWRKRFLEAVAAGVLIGILFLTAGLLKREEFSVAISEVTDLYYEARQYPENSGERKKYCATAEKKLQDLSRNYREKEQQRRIELLLAWNAEFLDETEKAALYYENLLLYDAEYRVVYGEYGMFLLRIGQKEASQKLWKDYKKKEKTELLEEGESRNLKLWEEINEKK